MIGFASSRVFLELVDERASPVFVFVVFKFLGGQNLHINIVTIFLGLSVGSKLAADKFLTPETLGILILGMIAVAIGTATGVIVAKIINLFSKTKINPLIGAAGVSAVPMAARVVNKVG